MRKRTSTPAALTCLLVVLWCHAPAAGEVDCRITTPRLARTFYTGERVSLNIHAKVEPQTMAYEVRDVDGAQVAAGEMVVSAASPEVLQLGALQNGIYYLTLEFPGGEAVTDAFCVIPRPDDAPGDPALWGFQLQPASPELYAVLAQAGVRYTRFDLSWPDHERTPGNYNTAKADTFAAVCRRFGMQMIPTLGYTPPWTAHKPDDMEPVRSHTWYPDAVENWGEYVRVLRDRLADQTVTWPSREVVPAGGPSRTIPLVRSWEIWNEADQNFYYGAWPRYVDLLRIAHKTIKQHSPRNQVVYGGACAHWTEMGRTYAMFGQFYFDQIAWHSNRCIEEELPKYYYGSPQLGYRHGLPRPTIQTECYPVTKAGVSEHDYLLRLYATLKAWREEGYCYASIGQRLLGPPDPNSFALTHMKPGGVFVPNAKYVAYAVTRWLLADAAYVGPLDMGAGVTAHVFGRRGQGMLIAWADTGGAIQVATEPGAVRIDAMGRSHPVSRPTCSLALSGAPTVVLGIGKDQVLDALENYFELVMSTEYGFEYHVNSPYVRDLAHDSGWGIGDQSARMRETLRRAMIPMRASSRLVVLPLNNLALDIRRSMMNLVGAVQRHGHIRNEVPNSLWRLQRLAEWLAEACDSLRPHAGDGAVLQGQGAEPPGGQGAAPTPPGPFDLRAGAQLSDRLEQHFDLAWNRADGTVHPLSKTLIQRALRMADSGAGPRGPATRIAAITASTVALAYMRVEPAPLADVFVVWHLPTVRHMRKGFLFHPDMTHTLEAQVWNFTDAEVSGTIRWQLPGTWSPSTVELPFTAPANGYSERIPCQVTIPGDNDPWVHKWAANPASRYCVSIPEGLASMVWPWVGGELSDGRSLLPICYEAGVGIWVPGGSA